jgi:hypothetical protein
MSSLVLLIPYHVPCFFLCHVAVCTCTPLLTPG